MLHEIAYGGELESKKEREAHGAWTGKGLVTFFGSVQGIIWYLMPALPMLHPLYLPINSIQQRCCIFALLLLLTSSSLSMIYSGHHLVPHACDAHRRQ